MSGSLRDDLQCPACGNRSKIDRARERRVDERYHAVIEKNRQYFRVIQEMSELKPYRKGEPGEDYRNSHLRDRTNYGVYHSHSGVNRGKKDRDKQRESADARADNSPE
jgi:hypothetical protein